MRKKLRIAIRSVALGLLAPWARQDAYADPVVVGWRASVHVPFVGCVAFVRLDGSYVLGW